MGDELKCWPVLGTPAVNDLSVWFCGLLESHSGVNTLLHKRRGCLRTKGTRLLDSGPKSSFLVKVNLAFHLEIKVPVV